MQDFPVLSDSQPKTMEDSYLRRCSKGMVESIKEVDPQGVWLTQTWVFIDFQLWTKEKVSAFLSGVEGPDDMILLDLMSDLKPVYDKGGDNKKKVNSGWLIHCQFIWGSLPNFGAVKGLYGDLGAIAEGPMKAMKEYPDYFVGIGAFMEGIDQNVVVYDLLYV